MTERVFSAAEANAELEALRERLPRLREARHALLAASERITEAVGTDGGGVEGGDWFRANEVLGAEVRWLAERGILLRDPESGLVDFPHERDGRTVFLCWKLDEGDIGFYHEAHVGYGGRMPL